MPVLLPTRIIHIRKKVSEVSSADNNVVRAPQMPRRNVSPQREHKCSPVVSFFLSLSLDLPLFSVTTMLVLPNIYLYILYFTSK